MSTTVGAHSGAGPLSLMSCVRESSPLQDYETDIEKNVVSKRKFWNPKKWFRKKQKTGDDAAGVHHLHQHQDVVRDQDGSRSRSTGELSTDEEPTRSLEVRNSANMNPGLSVSHDSVFHPLNSSDLELDGAQSSSSLSISQPLGDAKLQTELSSRLRLRRGRGDTSEDDEGLPQSPPYGSPAAVTDSFLILEKTAHNKDLPTKSHSTCSDGSLLSMDGSEMDEDSFGLQSGHSSKVSLTEKESDLELLGPSFSTVPLNHSAAHHRVSVRPKRTYGAPRRKKGQLSSALPATPEVNEDSSIRSMSPESITTEPITELSRRHQTLISHEVKLKCNSLPVGATPPTSESLRLIRSKSNAGKSQDDTVLDGPEREEKLSLFERLFPRRSAKKKKKDAVVVVDGKSHKREEIKPIAAPRLLGAASRQRIQPMDIIDVPSPQEDIRSKIKIAGLSSLQQKILSHTEEPVKVNRPLSKSHSFKNQTEDDERVSVPKAASLDSVKNLEEPLLKSELTLTLRPAKCVEQELEVEEIEVVPEKSPLCDDVEPKSFITISGPSHTAIVNISSKSEEFKTVTRIQLTTQIPEFINKQLNKVEARPTSNIVFSMKSPTKMLPRKFSKEDVEIIEKESPTAKLRFKKNDSKPPSSLRKSSITPDCDSPPIIKDRALKARSISLDSLKSEENISQDKSSNDGVVLRRKSFAKQKNEEEPELMKVFARRSLKLKDSDVDQIQEKLTTDDTDKENTKIEPEIIIENVKVFKQPLVEIKKSPSDFVKNVAKEEPEVQLRRGFNNNIFLASQRATSLNTSNTKTEFHIKKQASLNERQWIKVEDVEEKKDLDEIINTKVEEVRTETKNFSQRRAEWEKRVQQAQK
ncbi:unnamed protein product [Ceutorhynchus assimilis]|uniref:DUF4592 domain-containing protein n=1 Tax=Ceutorhynchus assimilis TaxID=467358 RepID=A0A9N9ME21_9CUCU|nr:unnamed protein product [Ceutorhynchus assimilis]